MTTGRSARRKSLIAAAAAIAGSLLVAPAVSGKDADPQGQERIPVKVMQGLSSRFPGAEIEKWTRETEGDTALYDIEFRQAGRKLEADIKEDGTIHNWEREIAAADLPAAARQTVERMHPGAAVREIMEITAVHAGKDVLEGYEVVIEAAGATAVEVTVAADGTVLEDGADEDHPAESSEGDDRGESTGK